MANPDRTATAKAWHRLAARVLPGFAPAERALYRDLLVLGGGFALLTLIAYAATLSFATPTPRDGTSLIIGRDFLNFWMYGRAAVSADPGRWYDLGAYQVALYDLFGMMMTGANWSYPPTVMWLAAPFGLLPYLAALLLWSLLGPLLLARVARADLAEPRVIAALLLSPAAVFCLICGQGAFLITALLVGFFALLDRRPVLAGVLLGLLTVKPQLGLLFPVLLLAQQRWRCLAAAAATTLLLAALTTAAFGTSVWLRYVDLALPVQAEVLADRDGIAVPFYVTVYMNLRGLGVPPPAALAVQGLFAVAAAAAVALAARRARPADAGLLRAQVLAASACASPYLIAYDLLPLNYAALALLGSGRLDGTGRRLVQAVFWLAALQLALGSYRIPGAALVPVAFMAWLTWQLVRRPAAAGPDQAAASSPWTGPQPA